MTRIPAGFFSILAAMFIVVSCASTRATPAVEYTDYMSTRRVGFDPAGRDRATFLQDFLDAMDQAMNYTGRHTYYAMDNMVRIVAPGIEDVVDEMRKRGYRAIAPERAEPWAVYDMKEVIESQKSGR